MIELKYINFINCKMCFLWGEWGKREREIYGYIIRGNGENFRELCVGC